MKLIIVPHTHWDREWYLPFQEFRMKLVKMMDNLLNVLDEDKEFIFSLDGQTIVLEDYLEIRQENEKKLKEYIKEGRILIGPWYILPDEFLVNGESIIRNLLIGNKIASSFGSVMKIGYLPDMFGHTVSIPKILKGCGIDVTVIWRGVGEEINSTEFIWQSNDGTEIFTIYLPQGYGNGAHLNIEDVQILKERLDLIISSLSPFNKTSNFLVMNGSDHLEPQRGLTKILKELKVDYDVEIGSIPKYVEEVKKEIKEEELEKYKGEFRDSKRAHILPGVLSTRIYLKQENFLLENLLQKYAEPLSTFSYLEGNKYPKSYLDHAWKYLLQNQPHDSICGCSIDEVHDEMEVRFNSGKQITNTLIDESINYLASKINTENKIEEKKFGIIIFNQSGKRKDLATIEVPYLGLDKYWEVLDKEGNILPHQIIKSEEAGYFSFVVNPTLFRMGLSMIESGAIQGKYLNDFKIERKSIDTVEIKILLSDKKIKDFDIKEIKKKAYELLEDKNIKTYKISGYSSKNVKIQFLADVPDFGYSTYWLRETDKEKSFKSKISANKKSLENQYFKIDLNRDGSLGIFDKRNKIKYLSCNKFCDGGDAGDEYNYSPPEEDKIISKPFALKSEILDTGPVCTSLKITLKYFLPESLTDDRKKRNKKKKKYVINTYVSIYEKIPRINFKTEIENNIKDHRLRVHFSLPYSVSESLAEDHFGVVKRGISLPENTEDYVEQPMGTHPQKNFLSLSNGKYGLTIANKGLQEYEVLNKNEVAITLLRCVGWLSRDDLKTRPGNAAPSLECPSGQVLRKCIFEYSLIPHSGDYETGESYKEVYNFILPLKTAVEEIHSGHLPDSLSFLSIEPECCLLSCLKKEENGEGIIIRIYNITENKVEAKIKFYKEIKEVIPVNFFEEKIELENLKISSKEIKFPLKGFQILSFKIKI